MTTDDITTYDELPYPGSPFPQTHPDRLATIATLFGMQPADVNTARVFELGCTDGGNLIPMALAYPNAEFVGIDLSRRQIADGQATIDALGLTNIRLIHQNILDVSDQYGMFDYIIAHGVFSWVPMNVQEKIFSVVKQLMNPQGISYISYNTYPGWHMRGMLRDMMLYHTRQFSEPQKRIEQARALIDFLAKAVPSQSEPYGLLLSSELEMMQNWADSYIFHESLEAHNDPVYFHQFAERAGQHGLRYLGEASLSAMLPNDLDEHVASTLSEIGRDIIEMEQYMDFVRNRTFRQTLLCHDAIALDRTLTSRVCDQMQIRASLAPVSEQPDLMNAGPEQFRSNAGTIITAHRPVQKAAFAILSNVWPNCCSFQDLLAQARTTVRPQSMEFQTGEELIEEEDDLREALFQCFCDHVVELRVAPPNVPFEVSACPVASPLARYQATPSGWVTTLLHEQVRLDVIDAHLIRNLDGTRDFDGLAEILFGLTKDGTIVATRDGVPLSDSVEVLSELRGQLETRLRNFARLGLLVGNRSSLHNEQSMP